MSITIGAAILLSAVVGGLVGWRVGTTAVKFPDYRVEPSASVAYADIEERAIVHARQRRTKLTLGLGLVFPCLTYVMLVGYSPQ